MTVLHQIGDGVREVLGAIPLWGVRTLFVALPAAVLLWALTLPPGVTTPDRPNDRGQNLKWGVGVALGIQILIHAFV
jgi:hypothetical protein